MLLNLQAVSPSNALFGRGAIILIIAFGFSIHDTFSQITSGSANCNIRFSTQVKNSRPGMDDGSITFNFVDGTWESGRFSIINITESRIKKESDKIVCQDNVIGSLAPGKYEFVLIDRKQQDCAKEILIEVKEEDIKK